MPAFVYEMNHRGQPMAEIEGVWRASRDRTGRLHMDVKWFSPYGPDREKEQFFDDAMEAEVTAWLLATVGDEIETHARAAA